MDENDLLRQLIKENIVRQILYEGLILSHTIEDISSYIKKFGYKYDFKNNKFNIIFPLNKTNKERYEILNQKLDSVGGWMHGASMAGNILKNKLDFLNISSGTVILQYEPKHDVEVFGLDILYHLTSQRKLDKIKKTGLTPRNSEEFFNFKDRIYFALNKKSLYNLAKQKKQIKVDKIEKNNLTTQQKQKEIEQSGKFAILTIQTKDTKLYTRFFKDPNFFDGYYTKENIHPFSIKDIECFEI